MSQRLADVKESANDTKDNLIQGVKETVDALLSGTKENLDHQMEVLGERFEALSTDVRRRLHSVDDHLHQKPYMYLIAVGAIGISLGLMMRSIKPSET